MKLQHKVLMVLTGMWVLISLATYFDSSQTLLKDYERLEKKEVTADTARAVNVLESSMNALIIQSADWGQWDDAYQFINDQNQKFINSNLQYTTFANTNLNAILFVNNAGDVVFARGFDLNKKQIQPISEDLRQYLHHNKWFTTHKDKASSRSGFINLPQGLLAISALPVLPSSGEGTIRGSLLMGYFVTQNEIKKLGEGSKMQMELIPLPLKTPDVKSEQALNALQNGASYFTVPVDKNMNYGFAMIRDIKQQPVALLRIESPRTIYNEGIATVRYYIAVVIGIGFIVLFTVWYLLKILIIDRVVSASKQVAKINKLSAFDKRIKLSGKDEVNDLVVSVNQMLEIIDLTQEQLKYRISRRTEELERLSALNKNLYEEIQYQKEIESTLRNDKKLLHQMAYYDALTLLPNRVFFYEMLQKALDQSKHQLGRETGIAIMLMDTDKFKQVNDLHGHDVGDKYLQYCTNVLKSCMRGTDVVARLGGDEFILFINNVNDKVVINVIAEKILQALAKPVTINQCEIQSTYSIGISLYPADGETIEVLEKCADLAMYYAKNSGGNNYCYYDSIVQSNPLIATQPPFLSP